MKWFLLVLVCLVTAGGIIYAVPTYRTKASNLLSYSECDTPLPYRIGVIDARFGLSHDEVAQDIQQAIAVWGTAARKTVFVYSPTATLSVNFIYDQRQALNSSINQLNSNLQQKNQALSQQIAQYQADVASFKQKIAALNAKIDAYNQAGGAPPDIYKDLINQQNELKAEADSLNQRAKQLNLSTTDYNDNVSVLDHDINQFNSEIAQKPEEGLYNGANNTITIYLTNGHDELIHTLAHEFGHSLGMQHVADPKGIMYPYTTSSLVVTADDMQQLSYVCRKQSLIVHELQAFDIWVVTMVQHLKSPSLTPQN